MRVLDDWLLTPARAAVHLPTATAVIADVHLGYGEARGRIGDAVPRVSVAAVFEPLRAMLIEHRVERLVIAGDLFEAGAIDAMARDLLAWCAAAGVELHAVVPGNHDRHLATEPLGLPVHSQGLTLGAWTVVHGDATLPAGRVVQGHEHPCLRWRGGIGGPCYLFGEGRLILPAFSGDAAGVNVLRDERWQAMRCWVIAGEKVLDFGEVQRLEAGRINRSGTAITHPGRGASY